MDNLTRKIENFDLWWKGNKTGLPLMRIVAHRSEGLELDPIYLPVSPEDRFLNEEKAAGRYQHYVDTRMFFADSYPCMPLDFGAGSMALYLGCSPIFEWPTVWFEECIPTAKDLKKLAFDSENFWWKKHLKAVKNSVSLSKGKFLIDIPDIIENLDILASLRGSQNLLIDLLDSPECIKQALEILDGLYFEYYDPLYNLVKTPEGASSYTSFLVMGSGKTAKVQCDLSPMLSPKCFDEFVLPYLARQCTRLDNSIYHLDGSNAMLHLDSILSISDLTALQFTPEPGQPDCTNAIWYDMYDKTAAAGKSLWATVSDGKLNDWIASGDRFINRYGSKATYLLFPEMDIASAEKLMTHAEKFWH